MDAEAFWWRAAAVPDTGHGTLGWGRSPEALDHLTPPCGPLR